MSVYSSETELLLLSLLPGQFHINKIECFRLQELDSKKLFPSCQIIYRNIFKNEGKSK